MNPSSAIAAVASASRRCLNAGSTQARATTRAPFRGTDLGLVGVDQLVQRGRIDEPLLGEERLEGLDPELDVGERGVVGMVGVVEGAVVVVLVAHGLKYSRPGAALGAA